MKSVQFNVLKIAMVVFVTCIAANITVAQENWHGHGLSSCNAGGSCNYGHRASESPYPTYDQGYRHDHRSHFDSDYYHTNRSPYHSGFNDYARHDRDEGTCHRSHRPVPYDRGYQEEFCSCMSGRCPYQRGSDHEYSRASRQHSYDSHTDDQGPSFYQQHRRNSSPFNRQSDRFQRSPADLRPKLVPFESYAPSVNDNFGKSGSQSDDLQLSPPSSTRLLPPPILAPQPRLKSSGSQQSSHDHAGHDHSGHNHSH